MIGHIGCNSIYSSMHTDISPLLLPPPFYYYELVGDINTKQAEVLFSCTADSKRTMRWPSSLRLNLGMNLKHMNAVWHPSSPMQDALKINGNKHNQLHHMEKKKNINEKSTIIGRESKSYFYLGLVAFQEEEKKEENIFVFIVSQMWRKGSHRTSPSVYTTSI